MVVGWAAVAGAACSSQAATPNASPCGFVAEGALPEAVTKAGDPLTSSAANKALRDVYAQAHGREAGMMFFEPTPLGAGWAVHVLGLEPLAGAESSLGGDAVIALVHVDGAATWFTLAAPRPADPATTQLAYGAPIATDLVAGGAKEVALSLRGVSREVTGGAAKIGASEATLFVGIVDGAPRVLGGVKQRAWRWDAPLVDGRAPRLRLSQIASPPVPPSEGVSFHWDSTGTGKVHVAALDERGTTLPATHPLGAFAPDALPVKCPLP